MRAQRDAQLPLAVQQPGAAHPALQPREQFGGERCVVHQQFVILGNCSFAHTCAYLPNAVPATTRRLWNSVGPNGTALASPTVCPADWRLIIERCIEKLTCAGSAHRAMASVTHPSSPLPQATLATARSTDPLTRRLG